MTGSVFDQFPRDAFRGASERPLEPDIAARAAAAERFAEAHVIDVAPDPYQTGMPENTIPRIVQIPEDDLERQSPNGSQQRPIGERAVFLRADEGHEAEPGADDNAHGMQTQEDQTDEPAHDSTGGGNTPPPGTGDSDPAGGDEGNDGEGDRGEEEPEEGADKGVPGPTLDDAPEPRKRGVGGIVSPEAMKRDKDKVDEMLANPRGYFETAREAAAKAIRAELEALAQHQQQRNEDGAPTSPGDSNPGAGHEGDDEDGGSKKGTGPEAERSVRPQPDDLTDDPEVEDDRQRQINAVRAALEVSYTEDYFDPLSGDWLSDDLKRAYDLATRHGELSDVEIGQLNRSITRLNSAKAYMKGLLDHAGVVGVYDDVVRQINEANQANAAGRDVQQLEVSGEDSEVTESKVPGVDYQEGVVDESETVHDFERVAESRISEVVLSDAERASAPNLKFIFWRHVPQNVERLIGATQDAEVILLETSPTDSDLRKWAEEEIMNDLLKVELTRMEQIRLQLTFESDTIDFKSVNLDEHVQVWMAKHLLPEQIGIINAYHGSGKIVRLMDANPQDHPDIVAEFQRIKAIYRKAVFEYDSWPSLAQKEQAMRQYYLDQGAILRRRDDVVIGQVRSSLADFPDKRIAVVYGKTHTAISHDFMRYGASRIFLSDAAVSPDAPYRHTSLYSQADRTARFGKPLSLDLLHRGMLQHKLEQYMLEVAQPVDSKRAGQKIEDKDIYTRQIAATADAMARRASASSVTEFTEHVRRGLETPSDEHDDAFWDFIGSLVQNLYGK